MPGFKSLLVCLCLAGCTEYDVHPSVGPVDPPHDTDADAPVNEDDQSYLGKDFLAVTTANPLLPGSFANDFAIVVTNPDEDVDANVVIRLGDEVVAEVTVHPDEAETVVLPMIPELQLAYLSSIKKAKGAYEIKSDIPIAAYQFNPLHYQSTSFEPSYTNDASMLLPENVLGGEYMVGSYSAFASGYYYSYGYPGFAAVAATEDGTSVTVHSRTTTLGGDIAALSPGQEATITLDRGDVLEVFSAATVGADLTGSMIEASAPVAVFGGHVCTNMPLANPSCDHLEEMMQPVETWGRQFVMTAVAHPDTGMAAPTMYRVVALNDGTDVTFDPAVTAPVTLDAGQIVEFATTDNFLVQATGPISAYQYMESCTALGTAYGSLDGDPSMGSGIPLRQARTSYVFLVPDTYQQNWVNVVAEGDAGVELDGEEIARGDAVGSSPYWSARVSVGAGSHRIVTTDGSRFTITVYGYADYTSYLYPGGMNFQH
jgi:hypothetical protein